jgi:hypothetical protein
MANSPKSLCASIVESDEAMMLTKLLPIKIALNILDWLSIIFPTNIAFLLPSSIKVLILMLLTVVKAVSADEKKPERKSSNMRTSNIVISLEFKINTPYINILLTTHYNSIIFDV